MRSTFITVLGWTFLLACVLTTLLIIVKSVRRFGTERKSIVIAKAVAALVIWAVFSIGNLIVLTGYAASETIGGELPLKLGTAELSVAGALLIYLLAGYGLIYWTSRQRKAE